VLHVAYWPEFSQQWRLSPLGCLLLLSQSMRKHGATSGVATQVIARASASQRQVKAKTLATDVAGRLRGLDTLR
jgi:hypothetical protein